MSRIGQMPIVIPKGSTVTISGNEVIAKGPNGELRRSFHPEILISLNDNVITVSRPTDERNHRSMHGLTRSLIANMVEGVSQGFKKNLELVGVGYRAQKSGEKLILQVGYSHPVEIIPPPGISITVEGTNRITISGNNKELVGEIAARIRKVRPPNVYKGKGIRYANEKVRLKPGKSGKVGKAR